MAQVPVCAPILQIRKLRFRGWRVGYPRQVLHIQLTNKIGYNTPNINITILTTLKHTIKIQWHLRCSVICKHQLCRVPESFSSPLKEALHTLAVTLHTSLLSNPSLQPLICFLSRWIGLFGVFREIKNMCPFLICCSQHFY